MSREKYSDDFPDDSVRFNRVECSMRNCNRIAERIIEDRRYDDVKQVCEKHSVDKHSIEGHEAFEILKERKYAVGDKVKVTGKNSPYQGLTGEIVGHDKYHFDVEIAGEKILYSPSEVKRVEQELQEGDEGDSLGG